MEIRDIGRHAAGTVLNLETVQAYIGEVCPVPMPNSFPFGSDVASLFNGYESLFTLDVRINGMPVPVTRPYGECIQYSVTRRDRLTEFEVIQIPALEGGKSAVGWVAHSSYLGMIPRNAGVRGIRARSGNIQIGDETVFEHLFPEERFNRWCVGEVHMVDSRIIPTEGATTSN